MQHQRISASDKVETAKQFNAADMMVSLGDLAHAAHLLFESKVFSDAEHLAHCICSLSHLVNRIVLSDRMFYILPDESEPNGWSQRSSSEIIKHCKTFVIESSHPLVTELATETFRDPGAVFGKALFDNVVAAEDLIRGNRTSAADAILAEYGISSTLNVPYAANPYFSSALGLHAVRPKTTAENLIAYVQDLRKHSSEKYNLLRDVDMYDLNIPLIFSAVLKECNEPSDIIKVAAQMSNEAKSFRTWCQNLDADSQVNYLEKYKAAEATLDNLGKVLGADKDGRLQVTPPLDIGLGIKVPSATLTRMYHWLDVDVRFVGPRSYLLNLLGQAREMRSLHKKIAKVFKLDEAFTKQATDVFLTISEGV